ncbi:serine/threonine-protein kinase [Bodo saltans virus]|uniref:Serine/threonine-protein kinase n=1 Tax=Bodo saltans virus TaxID=2024608 RepID=A0A2H4UVE2_9VIRU|nr:serine/threonine-protein kinase [Bodo saltans virus]ATZ80893.1 serine/threonine-protein kinase [Bodo saltans virus]
MEYTILEKIGKGGFGNVYKAKHKITNDIVALKTISLKSHKQISNKIKNELKVSKTLIHPNIVKYYDAYYNNKTVAIIYEFCDGDTLKTFIKKLHMSSIDNLQKEIICKKILCQIKNAIEYMYTRNVVHRDLKPENILFKKENNNYVIKLIDFGFSRFISTSNIDTNGNVNINISTCGTPFFMAPEMLCGQCYNIKADLWSFGIMMYQLLYNKMPYQNVNNYSDLINKIKNETIHYDNIYSEQCIHLLKLLLNNDSDSRISWEQFINDKWFCIDNIEITEEEMIFDIKNLSFDTYISTYTSTYTSSEKEKNIIECSGRTIELSFEEEYVILN